MKTDYVGRALKQLDNAAVNLDNGTSQDWRGRASVLIGRIRLALQYPGHYEIKHLAEELEKALLVEAKRRTG